MTLNQKEKLNNDFNPTAQEVGLGDAVYNAPVVFEWISTAAFNSAAVTAFTAPFPMRLFDIIVEGRNAEAAVVTVRNGANAVCTAITAADQAVIHMTAGAVAAELLLEAGDVITVQSGHANSRAAITFIGVRV
jgi:hypothetical protein